MKTNHKVAVGVVAGFGLGYSRSRFFTRKLGRLRTPLPKWR